MIRDHSNLVDQLHHVDGKAEIINGEIQLMSPTGYLPGRASGEIYISLREHERTNPGQGHAVPDNVGFLVDLPSRESFSPDAAFHTGKTSGMQFIDGAPAFAAEVRSENDYGPSGEEYLEAKRADYFLAGTLVVWDVDLRSEDVIRVYRNGAPTNSPTVFHRGDVANAEPAVPGWTFAVDDLFDDE